ncbi:ATP-binding cassette domain-containing protein [uncultured Desulfobacter sp.]|uniref:ATP-binding cassette domain-containing protein n=1 Tax=uncultured Desulfobacter sp. TaxID=240139 RepID=UPI002AAA72C5|nr:ATP-binding cassette domain-containing protein [uncultured Desulfobacter sp.]
MSESSIVEITGVSLKSTHEIHLCVEQADRVLISGGEGSGKTTLLKIMNGLVEPEKGKVMLFNNDIRSLSQSGLLKLRQNISYLGFPQGLLENWTVYQNLSLPLKYHWNMDDHGCDRRIEEIEQYLGPIRELLGYPVFWMDSETQRLLTVFRGLVIRPRLLLLDPDEMKLSKPGQLDGILQYVTRTQTTTVITDSIYLKSCAMETFRTFNLTPGGEMP